MSRPAADPAGPPHTEVYTVPTDQPERDGTCAWESTTLAVVRVAAGGCEGLGWTYGPAAVKAVVDDTLAAIVEGSDPMAVTGVHERMVRACRDQGRPGVVACAISAVDIALWDLKGRLLGLPLADLWGRMVPAAAVYGSGGFTTYDARTLRGQLQSWAAQGIHRVKIKIGDQWGGDPDRDRRRVAQARHCIGGSSELYVDANGAYTRKQAIRLGRRLVDELGVTWFEEPVSSDDVDGLRAVRDNCGADVAAGEYGYAPAYFARLIAAGAVDCVQVDVTRCGAYTDWLAVAHLAAAHGLQVSGHGAPNLHAHAAVTIANLRHLEYFHDHSRIEALLFDGALDPRGGELAPGQEPGHGMTLRAADAETRRIA